MSAIAWVAESLRLALRWSLVDTEWYTAEAKTSVADSSSRRERGLTETQVVVLGRSLAVDGTEDLLAQVQRVVDEVLAELGVAIGLAQSSNTGGVVVVDESALWDMAGSDKYARETSHLLTLWTVVLTTGTMFRTSSGRMDKS